LTVIDLFAGVGGFSLGFIQAKARYGKTNPFELRLLADIDATAAYTFKKNYPSIPYLVTDLAREKPDRICELSALDSGELDVLIGGPPCQGFSTNGKRWIHDSRNAMLLHFIDLALRIRPKCVLIENVPAALLLFEKAFKKEIEGTFRGYHVEARVVNASAFGVPQIRKRAFVVAIRDDLSVREPLFPEATHLEIENGFDAKAKSKGRLDFVNVQDAIGDLPSLKPGARIDGVPYAAPAQSAYQRQRRMGSIGIFNHVARAHSKDFVRKLSVIRPGGSNLDLPDDKRFSDNYYSQAYGRLRKDSIAFTLTANFRNPGSGRFMHYRDKRSLTVREAARLQSFDDRFIFHGFETDQERHVGNAVPPLLAEAFAEHLQGILFGTK
jgi:DNA (cytosine-5)-methyltransferase 1